ncbi:MAG: glutamine synthetase [Clostridia bacterium]|nr:glutamine synthetase [Clostridia bacterium]MBQ1549394.1 glutamine synthetase [Clostridia bacterium]
MMYTREDVLTFVEEEDVKFIRLAFVDLFGKQKNIAIMPGELKRAFEEGIPFASSNIDGFKDYVLSNLYLHPDPSTLSILPWRPSNGRVVRMFCNVTYPDGTPFEGDSRSILQAAIEYASKNGVNCTFGNESEFYLFKTDDEGRPTKEPFDEAGYLDIAPEDKGENVRREICFTLSDMGIVPESSHHEAGPGQNEVDFRYSDPLTAAEDALTLRAVIKTIAMRNGLYADFSPKPLEEHSGNGMHINIMVHAMDGEDKLRAFMAGILRHIEEITFFLNPTEESYRRFGEKKAPVYISWSSESRNQLIMIPECSQERRHLKLRSPDSGSNPYIAYALLIYAGLDGVLNEMDPGEPTNLDLADSSSHTGLKKLPLSLDAARDKALNSTFVRGILGDEYLKLF